MTTPVGDVLVDDATQPRSRAVAVLAACVGLYVVASLLVTWNLVAVHPTTTSICGCGDPARYLWFIEYPAWAIATAPPCCTPARYSLPEDSTSLTTPACSPSASHSPR